MPLLIISTAVFPPLSKTCFGTIGIFCNKFLIPFLSSKVSGRGLIHGGGHKSIPWSEEYPTYCRELISDHISLFLLFSLDPTYFKLKI